MDIEIIVPTVGESIAEATVLKWLKSVGDEVAQDEPLLELETDKVTLEVLSPVAGVIKSINATEGEDVEVGIVLGLIDKGASAAAISKADPVDVAEAAQPPPATSTASDPSLMPAARRLVDEHGLESDAISATGKGGRVTKGDVLAHIDATSSQAKPASPISSSKMATPSDIQFPPPVEGPREERVPMTRLRRRVAERLKEAQNTAAMLTTFNEVDMTAAMAMRSRYKEAFEKKHGVRIGYMSIFAKACVAALREFPAVNAEISGNEIIYKNYYDISVAVGTERGLVVPVVRDVGSLSFAGIETKIRELGAKAKEGRLALDELQGGTFTITNGGIYGSMMSTPILNAPQSGILGMHNIVERAMVMPDGTIQARPMMYLALSYDHRIVDGREAVGFLIRVKECIEDPQRIMLDA
ncbi:MAG: 2-oxoglutarate dehydrogenase complex dihydrolipoyllysine-residue succinyltransferase [Candidatus Polarisedimenticolaceae bacterium]|nr:2-oxoglutarate dehydrogenase complex dihydrolipoyllysine-residue succinyltransferase [Candidatus Polarisedimenticolaceae bacterium]